MTRRGLPLQNSPRNHGPYYGHTITNNRQTKGVSHKRKNGNMKMEEDCDCECASSNWRESTASGMFS